MKKVININFQGRVIPIEESAYEILQNYTDSLRKYFAREEGRDEIINDIENRIAELFTEDLKKSQAGCVTEADVAKVINSMGKPEEFDGEGVGAESGTSGTAATSSSYTTQDEPRGSLFRNENDKVLGGVCSGLAHYLKMDPTIVRVLFALVTLGGFGSGIPLYIILWIVLPAKGMQSNMRKRLYRNPDSKVIGGVAGGIAAYFNIAVWIPRVIFAIPLIAGVIGSLFQNIWFFGHGSFPDVVFSGFGGTLAFIYIVLWIVIPEAKTASEKLEMRGEKVDLESIKNSVQEELQGLKGRAEKFGAEFGEKAKEWGKDVSDLGKEAGDRSRAFSAEVAPAASRAGNGLGHAIGVLFKAFFLFIAGITVFALFVAFTAIIFSGFGLGMYDLKNFFLTGFWQNFLAFNTIFLLFGVPIIAAIVWIIRRMTGSRSNSSYLGWVFGSLWTIGIISATFLAAMVTREFKRVESVQEDVAITNPANGRLHVDVMPAEGKFYNLSWFDDDSDDIPFMISAEEDSLLMNTVKVKIDKSDDSNFHAYIVKFARASSPVNAEVYAEKIEFPISQKDSTLFLSSGFAITKDTKFRNQQVLVVVEVPVGKQINLDNRINDFDWFTVSTNKRNRNRDVRIDWEDEWDRGYGYKTDIWYTMTPSGLEKTDKRSDDWNTDENDSNGNEDGYRYKKERKVNVDSMNFKMDGDIKINGKDTTINIKLNTTQENRFKGNKESDEEVVVSFGKGRRGHTISVLDLMMIGR
jgi:phage shock protein PspC (stress-responsive transcriptional regulator)